MAEVLSGILSLVFMGPGIWSGRREVLPMPTLLLEQRWLMHTLQAGLLVSLASLSWYHVSLQSPLKPRTEQLERLTTSLVGAATLKLLEGVLMVLVGFHANRF